MSPESGQNPEPVSSSSYDDSSLEAQPGTKPNVTPVAGSGFRLGAVRYNRMAFIIAFSSVLLIGLISVTSLLLIKAHTNNQPGSSVSSYASGNLSTNGLKTDASQLQVGAADHLAVNGELRVSNTVVLAPSGKPSDPTPGQIYYDSSTNAPYYYNGSQFISLAPAALPQYVSSVGGVGGPISVGNGLQITSSGQLSVNSSFLSSAQATQKFNSLKSGSSNLVVSSDGQGNYVLTDSSVVNTGIAGQIALITGSQTISGSALSQSGTAVTAAGALTVTGALSTNSLQQTVAGNNVSISAGNDALVFTAGGRTFQFPTTGAAAQTICTTGITCASGGGQSVLLQPGSAQLDTGAGSSVFINNTGGGNLLELQGAGSDRLVVTNTGTLTLGDATHQAGLTLNAGNGHVATIQAISTLAQNTTYILPDPGAGGATFCLSSGNCTVSGTAGGDLSGTYPNPSVAKLQGSTLTISSPAGGQVLQYNGSAFVNGLVTNTNLQAGNFGNINGTGSLTSGSIASGFGTIATANSITTSAALQGGTLSVASGSFTINSSGDLTTTGIATIQGAGGISIGVAGTTAGNLVFANASNSHLTTLQGLAPTGQNQTITIPASSVASDTVCLFTLANCAGAGGGVTASGGTQNYVPKFTNAGATQLGNSLIFDNGTSVGVATATPGASYKLDVNGNANVAGNATIGTGLTVTAGGATISAGGITVSGNSTITGTLSSLTGLASSGTITFSALNTAGVVHNNASGDLSTGLVVLGSETTGNYIDHLGGLTGLTTSGNSGAGSTPTLAVIYGATAATAVEGDTSLTCASGTGNLTGGGNTITLGSGGGCNSLDVVNSPTFSGTLSVQGAGGITVGVAGTTAGVLNLANSSNSNLSALQAAAPSGTGTATYVLPSIVGGNSDTICLHNLANCAGVGGGVTGSGTAGDFAVFSGGGTIGNSSNIKESGTTVTDSGTLVIQGANALTLGTAGPSGNTGAVIFNNATNSNTVTLQSGAPGSSFTLTLPATKGNSGDCLQSDGTGALSFAACTGGAGGGVTSLDAQTGVLTLANSSGSGGTITINDASTSQKGIAQFNSTNFTVSSGSVNTVQDIATSSSPSFSAVTLSSGNLNVTTGTVQTSGTDRIDHSGNLVNIGTITSGLINGQTISSSANFTGTLTVQGANVTVGTSTAQGHLVLNDGNGASNHTATIQSASNLAQDTTYILPDPGSASATFCLSTNNCSATGTAGGDLTGSYPNPTIAKLQGKTLTVSATPATGAVLQYNGSAFVDGLITNSNLQSGSFANITGTGALSVGSIASGFGVISTGNNITTTTALQGGTLAAGSSQQFAVNASGNFSTTGTGYINTNSTTALNVEQNGSHNNVLTVDTTNGRVGIGGTPSGSATLQVNGSLSASSYVSSNNSLILSTTSYASGFIDHYQTVGATAVSQYDAVVYDSAGKVVSSSTLRDPNVAGVAIGGGSSGATIQVAFAGNYSVSGDATSAPINIGDQLVTSTNGRVIADNSATTGIVGRAMSALASGTGPVNVAIQLVRGQTNPNIPGNLTVQGAGSSSFAGSVTIQGANALKLGVSGTTDGAVTFAGAAGTHTVTLQAPASDPASNLVFKLPSSYGSNGNCLESDGSGGLSFQNCTGGAGGGVTSIQGTAAGSTAISGILTLNNSLTSGSAITINDASTTQKGIAQFNSTNFTASSGVINTIQDIATASTPTFAGLTLNGALSITSGGASITGNLNISGQYQIGGSQISSAALSNDSNLAKLNGTQIFSGYNTFKPSSDSTSVLQIQNAAGSSTLFQADTTNTAIGIAGAATTAGYALNVTGSGNFSTNLYVNGVAVCTVTTCAGGGSGSYIDNGTTTQTANFNIQSAAAGSVAAVIQGASGGTADVLDVKDGSGNTTFAVGNTGNATFQASANSITAFLVQNAAGGQLFNIDSSAAHVTVGINAPSASLTNGSGGSLTAGLIYSYMVSSISGSTESTAIATSPAFYMIQSGSTNLTNTISWANVPGATAYKLYRSTDGGVTWQVNTIAPGSGTTTVTDDGTSYSWGTTGTPTAATSLEIGGLNSCASLATDSSGSVNCSQGDTTPINHIREYGHSAAALGYGWQDRLAAMLHANLNQYAVGGTILGRNDPTNGHDNYAYVLQHITSQNSSAPYVTHNGVGVYYYGLNDIGLQSPSVGQTPFYQALRTIVARDRAGSVKEESDSSVGFTGSWSQVNTTLINSGSGYKQATTNGDSYTISVPADFPGGAIDVGVIAGSGGNGAVTSFTVDGGAAGSIDTRNVAPAGYYTGMVKRFTGLAPGAHTIVGTVSSITGSANFDYWEIESNPAPMTVILNTPRSPDYSYFSNCCGVTVTDTDVNTLNANVNSVAAEFGKSVVVANVDSAINKNPAYYVSDKVHPNYLGGAVIANTVYQAIQNAQLPQSTLIASTGNNDTTTFKSVSNNTATFQVQNAGAESLLNVDTATTPNLFVNENLANISNSFYGDVSQGSFDSQLGEWGAKGSDTVLLNNTTGYSGNSSMEVDTTATVGDGAKGLIFLTAGQTYTFSFYARAASGTISTLVDGFSYNASDESTYLCTTWPLNSTSWTRNTCTFTPATTSGYTYLFIKQTDATARTFYVDDVQLETGSTASAFSEGSITLQGAITSPLAIHPREDGSDVFQVQNAAGNTIFNVNSTNGKITVSNNSSSSTQSSSLSLLADYGFGGVLQQNSSTNTGYGGVNSLNLINTNAASLTLGTNNLVQATIGSTGATTFKNSTNSATAFQVQPSGSSTSVLDVDTTNGRVGIGTNAPAAALDVETNLNGTGQVWIHNGNSGSSASAQLLLTGDNGFGGAISENSSTNTSLGGANSLNIMNVNNGALTFGTSNTIQATIGSTGATTFKNSANSTSAFQIQAAGTGAMLNVDTSNRKINLINSITTVGSLSAGTAPVISAGANTGGSLSGNPATTYYYKVTAITPGGETAPTAEGSFSASGFTPISAPASAPTAVADAAAGSPNGTYKYEISYVTANGETTPGPVSSSVTVASTKIDLSGIPTGPSSVIARRVYRTLAGGSTYYLVASITDNTTTTYTDNTADSSLTVLAPVSNTATTNTNQLSVSFSSVSGATSYRVYRSIVSGEYSSYQTVASSPFTDTGASGTIGALPAAFQVQNASGANVMGVYGSTGQLAIANMTSCAHIYTDANNYLQCGYGAERDVSRVEYVGHSYVAGIGASSQNYRFSSRFASMLHAQELNHGVSGAVATGANYNGFGGGGFGWVLQNVKRTRTSAPYLPAPGIGVVQYGTNEVDLFGQGDTRAYIASMRTIIARMRASAVFEDTDSSVNYGSLTHSVSSRTDDNSGTGVTDITSTGTFTITVPSDFPGGTVDLGFLAEQNNNGAINSFTVDGVSQGSLDTHCSNYGNCGSFWDAGLVKRFTGLSAGSHTIQVTVSSLNTQDIFDYWQIEANPSYPVLVLNTARVLTNGNQNSTLLMNAALKNLISSEFDSSVIYVDEDAALNMNPLYYYSDGVHPNDIGHEKIAEALYSALENAPLTEDQLAYTNAQVAFSGQNIQFQNSFDSTTALQVLNAAGTSTVLNVDTTNGRVGIGTASPSATLQVAGTALFKPTTDSTTAFQIQNAGGTSTLFDADTVNGKVQLTATSSQAASGSELMLSNTDFSSNWTGTNWTFVNGSATHTAGSTAPAVYSGFTPSTGFYQVTFNYSNASGNGTDSITPQIGGSAGQGVYASSGTETQIIYASGSTSLQFVPTSSWSGKLTSVSVVKFNASINPVMQILNSSGQPVYEMRTSASNTNTILGLQADQLLTTANNITAVGSFALDSNTTGWNNTAVGSNSLYHNSTGASNTAVGYNTLTVNTTGNSNVAVGALALQANTTGSSNVAIGGGQTLFNNNSGSSNVAIGYGALQGNTSGGNNIAIGPWAGVTGTTANSNVTGFNNIFLGYNSGPGSTSQLTNAVALGTGATVTNSNAISLGCVNGTNGCTSYVNVGVGTAAPGWPLDVENNINSDHIVMIRNTSTGSSADSQIKLFTDGVFFGSTIQQNSGNNTSLSGGGSLNIINTQGNIGLFDGFGVTTPQFLLNSSGSATFKTTTNNTTAFQIQNSNSSVLFNADTSTTPNLVTMSGFEGGTSGWAARGSSTISQDSTNAWQGNSDLKIAATTAAGDGAKYNYTFTSGQQYTLSFYAKVASGSISDLAFGRQDNGSTDSDCQTGQTVTTSWTRFTCTFTAGAQSGTPDFYIKKTGAAAETIYIDGVQLQTGGTATAYSPGGALQLNGLINSPVAIQNKQDSTMAFQIQNATGTNLLTADTANTKVAIGGVDIPTGATLQVWGNINASTGLSTGVAGFVGTQRLDASGNLVNIGNFTAAAGSTFATTGANGFTFKPGTDNTGAFQIQSASSTPLFNVDTSTTPNMISNGGFETGTSGWSPKGSASIALDSTSQYEGNDSLKITTTAAAGDGAYYPVTLAPSTTYTLSFFYTTNTPGTTDFQPGRQDQSGTDLTCGSAINLYNGWSRASCTFTTGATITSSNIFFKQTDAVARTIWIDAVQLQTGSNAGPYQVGQLQLSGVISSPVSIKTTQSSTRAFAIYNSTGSNTVLSVDNTNGRVGIDVIGNPQNPLSVNALTTNDAAAQVAVATNGSGNKGMVIQAAASQTADLLDFENSSGTVLAGFTASGSLQGGNGSGTNAAGSNLTLAGGQGTGNANGGTINFQVAAPGLSGSTPNGLATVASLSGTNGSASFQNSVNSLTGFQVQTSGGASLLVGDTSNLRLGVDVTYAIMTTPAGLNATACSVSCPSGSLTSGATYRYKVTALDSAGGETAASTEASVAATATHVINLTWTAVSGASGYRIYRTAANGASGSEVYLTAALTNSFVDTGSAAAGTAAPPASTTAYVSTNVTSNNLELSVGGLGTPTGQVYVSGTLPKFKAALPNNSVAAYSFPFGNSMTVQGRYAYVAGNSRLSIIDVSNPSAPALVGSDTNGGSSVSMGGLCGVAVEGHYAYAMSAWGGGALAVYDISNPTMAGNPAPVGTLNAGMTGTCTLYVEGHYAFIGDSPIDIVDISNPAQPALVGSINANPGFGPVFVQGNYLYIADSTGNNFAIWNIANPANPVQVGISGGTSTYQAQSIYVQGRYAYIVTSGSHGLYIFDVSNPAAPTLVGSTTSNLTSPGSVYVQGRYAYVADAGANLLRVFDVSNPANPSYLGANSDSSLNAPSDAVVSGRYAYVLNNNAYASGKGGFDVYDLGGSYDQQLQAGGLEVGTLQVDSNGQVAGDFGIQGGLSVGQGLQAGGNVGIAGGVLSQGSNILAGGNNQLTTPTISTVTPTGGTGTTWGYEVTAVNAFGGETAASTQMTDSGGATLSTGSVYNTVSWAAVPGASGYKIYRTTAGGTPSTTGLIGSTTSTSFVDDGTLTASGTSAPVVNTTGQMTVLGSALFANTSNSTTALQVMTASASTVFDIDTTNSRVGIGTAAPGNLLSIGALTTAAGTFQIAVSTGGTTNSGIVVQSVAGQTSGYFFQAQTSTGTVLASIDYSGMLTVKGANVNGNLALNGHLITGNASGSTTATVGPSAGTGATCTMTGNDTSGQITLTTGSGSWATGGQCTITFSNTFGTAPNTIITPANSTAATAGATVQPYVTSSTSIMQINFTNADTSTNTYIFNYLNAQ